MAELVEIIEPSERKFVISLTETEANVILFLSDLVLSSHKLIQYKTHYTSDEVYTDFRPGVKEIMGNLVYALSKTSGYGTDEDYME